MNLTPEQKELGRRNFLVRAGVGVPALAAFGAAAVARGPLHGGPVKAALIGVGGEGKMLLGQCEPNHISIQALCDVNPLHAKQGADALVGLGRRRPREYQDWKEMLAKESLEAVIIASPLWTHADITVGCLEAGKHVLCEKMMAWDVAGTQRMLDAARKNRKVLEIGYQRFYNPMYQAAYENVIKPGVLGDVYHIRLVWHRNGSWRRDEKAPSAGYDPSPWGYPDWEHLVNWRLYWKYSQGLVAELGSHQVAIANWVLGTTPQTVHASGVIARYKDGREVPDHIYVTWDYPEDRTVTFSSIQSNAFDNYYEMILGTKGTLILSAESEAYLFHEGEDGGAAMSVTPKTGNAILDASASRVASASGGTDGTKATSLAADSLNPYRLEISHFCAAVRTGIPLLCGPERAQHSAAACIHANEALKNHRLVTVSV